METFSLQPRLLLIVLLALTTQANTQWQSDVRLTYDPGLSLTAYNNGRRIAANGNIVHVVWYDDGDGNFEIYYKRSADGGASWSSDKRATSNTAESQNPTVALSGSVVHLFWSDTRDGNYEIYYKRSTDEGIGWSGDTRLTSDDAESRYPSAAVAGSVVHLVWTDLRDGNDEIYYKNSIDEGITWSSDARLTDDSAWSRFPSVAASGQDVHVVWADLRDAGWEIYYKRSTDGGTSWGEDTRLTFTNGWTQYPSVSVSGSVVHVVWQDDRDGTEEIYYKRSTDGGSSWESDIRLTNNVAWSLRPSVAVSGSMVHIAWHDYRDGNAEIYYKRSTDEGVSWEADTRLTDNSSYSENASVGISGSVVHVVWQDDRDGNYEIYYEGNPTGNTVGVREIESDVPSQFRLEQNYPNPFNPRTTIRFEVGDLGVVSLKVYSILGQEVAKLVNWQMRPGSYEVTWHADGMASGAYFYRLEVGRFVQTKKLLLVR